MLKLITKISVTKSTGISIYFVCGVNYLPSSILDGPTFPKLGVAAVFCCMQSTNYARSMTDLMTDIHIQSNISSVMP